MKTNKTFQLTMAAMFSALIAVGSWISIPLPFTPVPVNLATLFVFLTGAILGAKWSIGAVGVYLALGAVGAPVFSGFSSGVGILVGPTGGYLVGYLVGAIVIGLLTSKLANPNLASSGTLKFLAYIISFLVGLTVIYTLGTIWFIHVTGQTVVAAIMACIVPFLIGDVIKILGATLLAMRLKPFVDKHLA
ncbi:MAG: biotin transporter BioY [Anaerovoracaceae bacterium]